MFITLTKDQFEDILPHSYEEIEVKGCMERVYQIDTKNEDVAVRIYSTVDVKTNQTRKSGADAIRLVYWGVNSDRPIGKGKKILRVEGKTTIEERINTRIEEFLNDAYTQEDKIVPKDYLVAILSHKSVSWNSFGQSLLQGAEQYGSLTPAQLKWVVGTQNSKNRPLNKNSDAQTFEQLVKENDPNFYQTYLDSLEEEKDDGSNSELSEAPEKQLEPYEAGKKAVNLRKKAEEARKKAKNVGGDDQVFISSNGEDVSLIPTKNYVDHKYNFDYFNPVQSLALSYKDEDCNMIISANTSAGKTIAVEPMMDSALAKNQKVLYLAPLKALVSEKYEDWQIRFPDKQITILTGDYTLSEKMKAQLNTSDIIVLTSEMLDSRTRKMESENNIFLRMAGLILVDESHILTMAGRGSAMEVALMRFTKINPNARVVLMSATMPNVAELGSWLTVLNNKKSVVLYCNWRPVELQMHFREHPLLTSSKGYPDYWSTQNAKRSMAIDIAMEKKEESFLVFVHDKNTGRDIVSRFKKVGETAVFHSADLEKNKRKTLEDSFRSRKLRVMVSTSTTAFGLNLPARNVIIVGTHRGITDVDELEIIQECGRAGRYGIDDEGHVFMIVPCGTTDSWSHKIANPRPVNSVLQDHETLAFHVLAEITNETINNKRTLMQWFDRSLAAKQEIYPFTEVDAQGLLDDLEEMHMIEYSGVTPYVSGLGKVSAWFYLSPYDVHAWHSNFDKIYSSGMEMDDELLAWAIGSVPGNDPGYVIKAMQKTASEWQWRLRNRGVQCGDSILSVIALYEQLSNKEEVGGIVNVLKRNIIFDIDRTVQALSLIDGLYAKWNQEGLWKVLPTRIKYGVPAEMLELVSIPGIGGVRAKQLFEAGLQSIEDVVRADVATIADAVGKITAAKIRKSAAEMKRS